MSYPYQQSPPSYPSQAGPQQSYNSHQQPSYPVWAPNGPQPSNAGWQQNPGYPSQGYAPQGYAAQGYEQQPNYSQTPYQADQKHQSPSFQPPNMQQRPVYQWSSPSSSVLNTSVRDPTGREVFTIETPKKKETIIHGASRQVIAKITWSSTPTISLRSAKAIKIKDWIPFSKETDCRFLNVGSDNYRLVEQNGSIMILKNDSTAPVGILSDPNDIIHLELSTEVLPLLEEFVVIATVLQSGHEIEKSGWFDERAFLMGMIGGSAGAAVSNAS